MAVSHAPDTLLEGMAFSPERHAAIRQNLAEPDPLRLAWRTFIKDTVHLVVTHPGADVVGLVESEVSHHIPQKQRTAVQALVLDELRRLHEGVLARYRLRPAQWRDWVAAQHGM